MSLPTTSINLNKTTPAPPTGKQNVVFQSDGGTPQQAVTAYDPAFVGDTGSGGVGGNVPAPSAGDAAANRFLHAGGVFQSQPMTVTFQVNNGSVGVNVCGDLVVPKTRTGTVTRLMLRLKVIDTGTPLAFVVEQNGSAVITVTSAQTSGLSVATTTYLTPLVTTPLPISPGDVFTLNITSGSSTWSFVTQLE